jgi:hypothetical protein
MNIQATYRLLASAWQGHFEMDLPEAVAEEIRGILNKLCADFPTLSHIYVREGDPQIMENILATKDLKSLILNGHYFKDPEKLRVHFETWKGLQVEATLVGTIIHECGHILANQALRNYPRKFNAILKNNLENVGSIWNYESPSAYGQENEAEFLAEAFVAHYLGRHGWTNSDFGAQSMAVSNAVWSAMKKLLK